MQSIVISCHSSSKKWFPLYLWYLSWILMNLTAAKYSPEMQKGCVCVCVCVSASWECTANTIDLIINTTMFLLSCLHRLKLCSIYIHICIMIWNVRTWEKKIQCFCVRSENVCEGNNIRREGKLYFSAFMSTNIVSRGNNSFARKHFCYYFTCNHHAVCCMWCKILETYSTLIRRRWHKYWKSVVKGLVHFWKNFCW